MSHVNRSLSSSAHLVEVVLPLQERDSPKMARKNPEVLPYALDDSLLHAGSCVSCNDPYCLQMKAHLHHKRECTIRAIGGCKRCLKLGKLQRYHNRRCTLNRCPLFHCRRSRFKQHMAQFSEDEFCVPLEQLRLVES